MFPIGAGAGYVHAELSKMGFIMQREICPVSIHVSPKNSISRLGLSCETGFMH